MPIDFSSLTNNAGVAKTFTKISADRNSAEWLNTSDSTASLDIRGFVKQQLSGKTKTGIPIRRSLIQFRTVVPTSVTIGGNTTSVPEECVVNLTVTAPTQLATLTLTNEKDLVAWLRALTNEAVVVQLLRGEV